jgi:rare lipoprotein A (peptidoglycan hydrolase)
MSFKTFTLKLFKSSLVFTCSAMLLCTTSSVFANEQPVVKQAAVKNVVFKKSKKGQGYVVYINNKQAMWFMKGSANVSAEARAKKASDQIQKFISEQSNPRLIRPVKSGSQIIIKAGDNVIATADAPNAKAFGVSAHELACTWANDTRAALGAPRMLKDYSIASRGSYTLDFERKYIGIKQVGLASWYGGNFHGKKSSDGSRYNKEEFTAAHKTLPFGTLVKVRNLNNGKICVVKITDRGPFVRGRILDLSKAGAKEIGVISSGIAKVQIEVVGKD